MKYNTMNVTGFWLPTEEAARKVYFKNVLVAKEDWDGEEDADDERIFFYMDNEELHVGDIISDGFVVIEIDEECEQ